MGVIVPPKGLSGIIDTFGDVEQYIADDGTLSYDEKTEFLVTVPLPFKIKYAYGDFDITKLTCHKLIAPVLIHVFEDIKYRGLQKFVKEYGGCFNFRAMRGYSKLSTHCWGISIDLNPRTNGLGTKGDMSKKIVEIFEMHGFFWGGLWRRPDPMHFQYCYGY
jgi:hypothetical protein